MRAPLITGKPWLPPQPKCQAAFCAREEDKAAEVQDVRHSQAASSAKRDVLVVVFDLFPWDPTTRYGVPSYQVQGSVMIETEQARFLRLHQEQT